MDYGFSHTEVSLGGVFSDAGQQACRTRSFIYNGKTQGEPQDNPDFLTAGFR